MATQVTLNSGSVDSAGSLALKTNGTTTAVTINSSQGVEFNAGTAALPSITTTGDTNTGIFFPAADTIAFSEGGAEAMRIDSSGNVSVGATSSSSQAFRVSQTALPAVPSGFYCSAGDGAGAYQYGITRVDATNGRGFQFLSSLGAGNLPFYSISVGTAASTIAGMTFSEAMRIDSSGNLLVGTTSTTIGTANFGINVSQAGGIFASRNEDGSVVVFYTGGNAGAFRVLGNGNAQNTNNSYGAISDVKLKENIVDASPKLADLMQVKVRNYNLIGSTTKQIGVVAQELETIFPAMIDETPDKDEEGNKLSTKTKAVKYSVFVPMLIKAIQEQQALIQSLTTRITVLETP